jgi:hypothetical protein
VELLCRSAEVEVLVDRHEVAEMPNLDATVRHEVREDGLTRGMETT